MQARPQVKRENLAVVDSKPKSQGGFLLGDKAQEEAERELQRREEQSLQEQKRLEKAGRWALGIKNSAKIISYAVGLLNIFFHLTW